MLQKKNILEFTPLAASLLALLLLLMALNGCNDSNAQDQPAQTIAEKMGKPQVTVAPVKLMDFENIVEANGILMPGRHTKLTALVGGKLETIRADIGQRVKKDDLLFQVRTVDYELALQQAEASLARAEIQVNAGERELKRMENLFQGGSATEQMRDQATTAFEDATAALKQAVVGRDRARQSLADCTVTAPYDGIITARNLQEGEFAAPGMEVLEIMDLTTLNAELNVSERYAGTIGIDASVTLMPSSGNEPVKGKIVAVNPKIDLSKRTYLIKVAVDNRTGKLQAGQFCTARLTLPLLKQQPAIPSAAIMRDEGQSTVWVVDNGKVIQKAIRDNGTFDGWTWIADGLKEGQMVVTHGGGGLMDNAAVEIIN